MLYYTYYYYAVHPGYIGISRKLAILFVEKYAQLCIFTQQCCAPHCKASNVPCTKVQPWPPMGRACRGVEAISTNVRVAASLAFTTFALATLVSTAPAQNGNPCVTRSQRHPRPVYHFQRTLRAPFNSPSIPRSHVDDLDYQCYAVFLRKDCCTGQRDSRFRPSTSYRPSTLV